MTEKRPGRPAYQPSLTDRQTVQEMKYCGEADKTIAAALGIDVDTMRKHLKDELVSGHAERRKEAITLLFQSARSGNVSAQKHLEALGRTTPGAAKAGQKPAEKLGKKEIADKEAAEVRGIFEPRKPPAKFKVVK